MALLLTNNYGNDGSFYINYPPKHVTGTGTTQSGQGMAFFSTTGGDCSHGIEGFCVLISTSTDEWQTAGQRCEHEVRDLLQTCLHGGQSPKWQRCGSRLWWWHSGGVLKKSFIFICAECSNSNVLCIETVLKCIAKCVLKMLIPITQTSFFDI